MPFTTTTVQEEDHMEPEPHYEDFRSLRRKIFEWEGVWQGLSQKGHHSMPNHAAERPTPSDDMTWLHACLNQQYQPVTE